MTKLNAIGTQTHCYWRAKALPLMENASNIEVEQRHIQI